MKDISNKELGPEGIAAAVDADDELQFSLDGLGGELFSKFTEYKDARDEVTGNWIEDLRAFMGQYDPETIAKIQGKGDRSQVYVGLTRTKVLAAYSRITDLLFQPGQQFFMIEPTPIAKQPRLEQELTEKAALEIMQLAETVDPNEVQPIIQARFEELKQEIEEETEFRVENMSETIKDQAIESNLEGKMKDAIMEQVIFGTGAMKTGTLRIQKDHNWVKSPEGFELIYEENLIPEMEAVSVFDLYPDPYATSVEDMRSIFRRHIISRTDFNDLKDYPGFNKQMVQDIVEDHPKGNHTEEQHERDRRDIAKINEYTENTQKFEVLEFWGSVNGYDQMNSKQIFGYLLAR